MIKLHSSTCRYILYCAKTLFSIPRKIKLFFFLFCKIDIALKRRQAYYTWLLATKENYDKTCPPLHTFNLTFLKMGQQKCWLVKQGSFQKPQLTFNYQTW